MLEIVFKRKWGERVQQLSAFAALAKDPNLIPSIKWLSLLVPVPEDPGPSPGLHRHCMHMVHLHTYIHVGKIPIHRKIKVKKHTMPRGGGTYL